MSFRIILAVSALLLILYFGLVGRRHPLQVGGITLTFLCLFVFALAPDLSTEIAHLVGIGRGVDLALYIAIVFLLSFTFNLYIGQQEQNLRLTQLTRKLALAQAQAQSKQQNPSPKTVSTKDDHQSAQVLLKTYAVIPMFEEEKVIAQVLNELKSYGIKAIVIDDGSSDQSTQQVQELIHQGHEINLICHPINLGQGAALMTGFDLAQTLDCDYVVTFDSDGQHDPQDALAMLLHLHKSTHLDMVLGSRFLGSSQNMPFSRRILLKLATIFTQLSGGPKLSDSHNGLRAIRTGALTHLQLKQARMAHASELLYLIKAKQLNFEEFPVTIKYTEHSLSKGQSSWAALTIVKDLFLAHFTRR